MRALWTSFAFQLSCSAQVPKLMVFSPSENLNHQANYPDFGLDVALESTYYTSNNTRGITLYSDACGHETRDCTDTCLDPGQMFGNLKTLHNCWVYQTISDQWAEGNLHDDSVSWVKYLGFKNSKENSSMGSYISTTILTCLRHTCGNNADCTKKIQSDPTEICRFFPGRVVADVGGIGVYISYAMQMGLALLAFIFAAPWMSIMYAVHNKCRTCLDVLLKRYKSSIAKERSRKPLIRKHYTEALTTALVDFQKAQCFFMLATNIAGLTMQEKGGLQPESFQQLYNTYFFIKIIAIGGFLPITFTLLTLYMVQKLSWYLLILSVITIGVAAASLITTSDNFQSGSKDPSDITDMARTSGPEACAKHKLSAYCYTPRTSFGPDLETDSAKYILYFCLVTTVILIVDHFCRSTDLTQQRLNHRISKKLHIASEKPLFPYAKRVLGFGTAAFHPIFFCIYLYFFAIFASDLKWFQSHHVYEPTWGFGQIVAILIFAPTLCDYLWNQTRGIEKGAEHRLHPRLEVRLRDNAGEGYTGGEAGTVGKEAALQVHEQEKLV